MAVSSEDAINSGPIAPERNPPINPEFYQPSRFVISSLVYGKTTLVTTSEPHNYVRGQLVRFLIPQYYGAVQLSGKEGLVSSIPSDTELVVEINSVGTSSFGFQGSPAPNKNNVPQIIALGDINSGAINAAGRVLNGTYIPGAFIDVS